MTGSRSAAQEAGDPSTSPERLLELTEKHPQLHRLIVLNPSCPDVARQWILATNPWAKKAYEQSLEAPEDESGSAADEIADEGADEDDLEPTALHPVVPDEPAAHDDPSPAPPPEPAPEDAEAVSAWGDFDDASLWGSSAAAASSPEPAAPDAPNAPASSSAPSAPSAQSSSSVRISQDAGVVPLGPAAAERPAAPTAAFPAVAAPAAAAPAVAPGTSAPVSAAPVGPAPAGAEQEDERSGFSRRTWFACGGCLLLALVLMVVLALGGRALLAGDEDEYQRDSSTTAQEAPSEEPAEEETTEEPSQDPVSPAPEGAQEMTELRSPTGNISCLLEEDTVSCTLVDRDFSEAGLEDCEDGPFSIQVADGDAATACGSSFLSDEAQTLEYDDSAVYGDMACTSRFDGMTCWNTMTGKGFMANKVTYETF